MRAYSCERVLVRVCAFLSVYKCACDVCAHVFGRVRMCMRSIHTVHVCAGVPRTSCSWTLPPGGRVRLVGSEEGSKGAYAAHWAVAAEQIGLGQAARGVGVLPRLVL